jgi:hypothetical protein
LSLVPATWIVAPWPLARLTAFGGAVYELAIAFSVLVLETSPPERCALARWSD